MTFMVTYHHSHVKNYGDVSDCQKSNQNTETSTNYTLHCDWLKCNHLRIFGT